MLWRKVAKGLSAGRVQSVATRIVVERERERMRFRSACWWGIEGSFAAGGAAIRSATRRRRRPPGGDRRGLRPRRASSAPPGEVVLLDEPAASGLVAALDGADFPVACVEERPYRRSPAAPFMTSTLQQEAARKLRFSAQRTMQCRPAPVRAGLHHLHEDRLDDALRHRRAGGPEQATSLYGAASVPAAPRIYRSKVKNAQEAHEAIRPAGDRFRQPSAVARELCGDELRLYELVWQRTVASQMIDATGTTARVRIEAATDSESPVAPAGTTAGLLATGTVITDPGFLAVYREDDDEDDEAGERGGTGRRLPRLVAGEAVECDGLEAESHDTRPPARYTEASLVRRLEELGVGPAVDLRQHPRTIQDRDYVWRKGTALVPSFTAFAVVGLMEDTSPASSTTASRPRWRTTSTRSPPAARSRCPGSSASTSARARRERCGPPGAGRSLAVDGTHGLKDAVSMHLGEIDAREVNSILIGTDADGREIVVRVGRYGPYLQRGEDRAAVPEDLRARRAHHGQGRRAAREPLRRPRRSATDPATGKPVLREPAATGPTCSSGRPTTAAEKPRTASLFKTMERAGRHPRGGPAALAAAPHRRRRPRDGRGDRRGQRPLRAFFEAGHRDAQPRQRGPAVHRDDRRGARAVLSAEAAPLRHHGGSASRARRRPRVGSPIVLRSGRFGPYVTDGTTNASLRRGDDPEELTPERALELHRGPPCGRAVRSGRGPQAPPVHEEGGRPQDDRPRSRKQPPRKKAAAAKKPRPPRRPPAKKAPATKKAAAAKKPARRAGPRGRPSGRPRARCRSPRTTGSPRLSCRRCAMLLLAVWRLVRSR